MYGQGVAPKGYHPITEKFETSKLEDRIDYIRKVIHDSVDVMPSHSSFISDNCKAALDIP